MKLALSMLCENPLHKTGLTTAYHEFVSRSLNLYSDVSWVVFVGPNQEWRVDDPHVEVVRTFPANDQLNRRIVADHWHVPVVARERKADMMISTGFVPMRKTLPTAMHVLSLQHLDRSNRMGTKRKLYRHWIMNHSWPNADLVITNSRFAAAQILGVFPEFHDRLVQIYEGLQHEQFHTRAAPDEAAQLEAKIGVAPDYFLWLSNFYPYKQGDRLLAGYALLDPETRRRHPLVMVGADWEGHLLACQEQARATGIAEDVKFMGWVGDEWLAPLYRHALAHVLPSREETFGRTVIESMACGTPVVVNNIAVMYEVTNRQALIVDFNKPEKVAEALRRVATDSELRGKLREGGLRRAQEFTFEKLTGQRIEAIRGWLEGKGRSQSLTSVSRSVS